MKLQLKEDPKEWRKAALLSLIGPLVLVVILLWKDVISWVGLALVLGIDSVIALFALLRPRWFRGYYRFMTRVGFYTIQLFGKVVLTVIYFCVVTPLGWALKLAGKDLLQLKPQSDSQTCWQPARQDGSLDRMF
jgi:hypothetical protein